MHGRLAVVLFLFSLFFSQEGRGCWLSRVVARQLSSAPSESISQKISLDTRTIRLKISSPDYAPLAARLAMEILAPHIIAYLNGMTIRLSNSLTEFPKSELPQYLEKIRVNIEVVIRRDIEQEIVLDPTEWELQVRNAALIYFL